MSKLLTRTEPVRLRRDRKLCPTIVCGPSPTEQAHKESTDINFILKDYVKTGFMRHAKEHEGRYDDVSSIDFQEAQILVANTKSMFEELPGAVRAEFDHDVGQFLDFVQNPANADELAERKLLIGSDGYDRNGSKTGVMTRPEYDQMLKDREKIAFEKAVESRADELASSSGSAPSSADAE